MSGSRTAPVTSNPPTDGKYQHPEKDRDGSSLGHAGESQGDRQKDDTAADPSDE